jgi:hypothetical protein
MIDPKGAGVGAFGRFVSALGSALSLLVLLTAAAAIVFVRTGSAAAGGQPTVDGMRATAADGLEAAMGAGGAGISFEVVQRNTLYAKEGGPRIEQTAPDDQTKVVAVVDELYLFSVITRGGVTADAFWMEMRGTQAPIADFSAAEYFARVLEQDGKLWRDDGFGWYLTDESPGVGMDPVTARLLPSLLRSLDKAASIEPIQLDGRLAQGIRGTSVPAAYPGVIAADGAAFTETSFAVDCWFDEQGRLVRLEARAKNLNQTTYDLLSTTVVTFSYGAPGDPPEPTPLMAPEVPPTSEPVAAEVQP